MASLHKSIIISSLYGRRDERNTTTAITPGALVALGSENTVAVHAVAKGFTPAVFATENELEGGTIRDAYGNGDVVQLIHALPGDDIQALLADDETIVIGDFLESAGDGTLQKYTDGVIIAQALEAIDRTESDADERIIVRIV